MRVIGAGKIAAARAWWRRNRPLLIVGLVGIGLACLPLAYCAGRRAGEDPAGNVKTAETDRVARDNADTARAADSITILRHEQELTHAISQVPDTKPDPVRIALGCQRLRAQGTAEADLPADCRPEGDRHP